MIQIVIIGAGNVGHHLFEAMVSSTDLKVIQWYNRDLKKIKPYQTKISITDNIEDISDADIYILAVSDDSISSLSSKLNFENRLVVHTSGSVSIHDLDKKHRRGVLYPLQSFTKGKSISFDEVPFCAETIEKDDLQILKNIAEALGSPFYKINADQRKSLHLSAVFVNNFTNQLYRIAHEISDARSINFDILKPLINETANKVQDMSPYSAQTGPALRRDKKTIKKHLKLLEGSPHKEIYEMLTVSIKKTHGR